MQEETFSYTPPQSTPQQPAPLYTPSVVIAPPVIAPVVQAPIVVAPVPLPEGYRELKLKQSGIVMRWNTKYSVDSFFYAQKMSSKETHKLPWYLAQAICTFDGVKLNTTEMHSKITGVDYLQLISAVMGTDEEDGAGE